MKTNVLLERSENEWISSRTIKRLPRTAFNFQFPCLSTDRVWY